MMLVGCEMRFRNYVILNVSLALIVGMTTHPVYCRPDPGEASIGGYIRLFVLYLPPSRALSLCAGTVLQLVCILVH